MSQSEGQRMALVDLYLRGAVQGQGGVTNLEYEYFTEYNTVVEAIEGRKCERVYRTIGNMSEWRCSECGSKLFYVRIGDYCKCGCRIVGDSDDSQFNDA